MTHASERTDAVTGTLARGLRDGLLQDLLAISMLIEGARARVEDHDEATAGELLAEAGITVRADIDIVRALIARLGDEGVPTARAPSRRSHAG